MTNAHTPTPAQKTRSVSRRFSYAFIGIVTLILIAFAAVGIVFNIILIEGELDARVDNVMKLARTRLAAPLKNRDSAIIKNFVEAIFLDASVVYAKISKQDQIVIEKKRADFELQELEASMQSSFCWARNLLLNQLIFRLPEAMSAKSGSWSPLKAQKSRFFYKFTALWP